MKPLIYAASEGPLSRTQAEQAFELLFNGDATLSQMGGLLMAMRARGESVAEYAAAAAVMRAKCIAVSAPENAMDIVGTGGDGVGKKASNCHGANATWYWRNRTCNVGAGCRIHIPDKARSTLWFINAVDAHIDHGCTRFNPIAWHHFGATNGRHNNIRAAHDRWQILGL